jgi:hypothetical protein
MSTSSAASLQFDFDIGARDVQSTKASPTATNAEVVRFPEFPTFVYPSDILSASTRNAGRINAASITEADRTALLAERQILLDRELAGSLSHEEHNRLLYVRWSLDRIDDAKHGLSLERLESMVSKYENFQADIARFWAELEKLKKSTGGRR